MGIVIRQSIKATLVNYVGAFIGFLTTFFVLMKYVEPEVIGLPKVFEEVATLIAGFAQLGTSASAMRFFPYFRNPENNHNGFFFYLLLMPSVGSVIFIGLFWLFREFVSDLFIEKSALLVQYCNWIIPLVVFLVFETVFETYANILMRIIIPKFIKEIGIRLMLLGVYLLYAFGVIQLTGLVVGFVLVYGGAMVMSFIYLSTITSVSLRHNLSFIDKPLAQNIGRYTLFLLIGALSGNIMAQLDVFMVTSQMGLSYTGIYTIAFYMAAVIEMPARSITAISSPLAAAALKKGDVETANQLYKKVSLHQFIAGSTLLLLIWINIDNIFAIIPNGATYEAGKWVVFFIALAKLVSVTMGFGGTLISFSRYYYWGLYFTFFLTGLTIYTNYLLIPRLGMTGAALATFITCLISYSWQQWIVLKKVKGNPYSIGMVKQIGVILFLVAVNYLLPRWIANPVADGCYRTLIIGILWFALVYYLRISSEINRLIRGIFVIL
ncbi:MAG: polysaccharide biosynthesis protein [Odoribacter sp.]|nr:polysaccharide biosynthesis protein [Odoribacter sp.]